MPALAASTAARPVPVAALFPTPSLPAEGTGTVELAGTRVKFARNEEIFGEGDSAEHVYRVLSGTVRLYRVLSDGRRQIDAFCLAGDSFGLEMGGEHRMSAEAVTDCELVATSRQVVLRNIDQSPAFGRQLFERAAADLARARKHVLLLGRMTALEKVAAFLLEMAERQGAQGVVSLPMSRQDIADYLGLTIETVSRTLAQLERKATVDVAAARRIVLKDPAALRRLNA